MTGRGRGKASGHFDDFACLGFPSIRPQRGGPAGAGGPSQRLNAGVAGGLEGDRMSNFTAIWTRESCLSIGHPGTGPSRKRASPDSSGDALGRCAAVMFLFR